MDTEMKAALAEVGVDLKIFANLMSLWQRDGVTQRELGRKLNFPEYFTSRNIDALVEAGFAERRPDPSSRRSYLIFLTEAGRAKGAELVPVIERVNESVLADLAEADRRTLMGLMGRVAGFARADAG